MDYHSSIFIGVFSTFDEVLSKLENYTENEPLRFEFKGSLDEAKLNSKLSKFSVNVLSSGNWRTIYYAKNLIKGKFDVPYDSGFYDESGFERFW